MECCVKDDGRLNDPTKSNVKQPFPRLDKADRGAYYKYTGDNLVPLIDKLDSMLYSNDFCNDQIDDLYEYIVCILTDAENLFVPRYSKNFYKFWWTEELSILKKAAVESNRIWKAAGKPRSSTIFNNKQQCRMQYRKRLRELRATVHLVIHQRLA